MLGLKIKLKVPMKAGDDEKVPADPPEAPAAPPPSASLGVKKLKLVNVAPKKDAEDEGRVGPAPTPAEGPGPSAPAPAPKLKVKLGSGIAPARDSAPSAGPSGTAWTPPPPSGAPGVRIPSTIKISGLSKVAPGSAAGLAGAGSFRLGGRPAPTGGIRKPRPPPSGNAPRPRKRPGYVALGDGGIPPLSIKRPKIAAGLPPQQIRAPGIPALSSKIELNLPASFKASTGMGGIAPATSQHPPKPAMPKLAMPKLAMPKLKLSLGGLGNALLAGPKLPPIGALPLGQNRKAPGGRAPRRGPSGGAGVHPFSSVDPSPVRSRRAVRRRVFVDLDSDESFPSSSPSPSPRPRPARPPAPTAAVPAGPPAPPRLPSPPPPYEGPEEPATRMVLKDLLERIRKKDPNGVFARPVTDDVAPGYSTIIKEPMDLQTVGAKLESGEYQSWDDLANDIELMCRNCLIYNPPGSVYHRLGLRMLKEARDLVLKARQGVFKRAAPRKPPPTAAPPLPSFTPPRRAGQTQAGDLSDSDDISVASLLSEEDSEGALVDAARARRGASRGGDGVSRHPMLKRPRRGEGRGDLENTVRLLRDNLDSEEEDELLAKLSQEEEMRQKHARLEAERRDQKKREAAEKRKHQMLLKKQEEVRQREHKATVPMPAAMASVEQKADMGQTGKQRKSQVAKREGAAAINSYNPQPIEFLTGTWQPAPEQSHTWLGGLLNGANACSVPFLSRMAIKYALPGSLTPGRMVRSMARFARNLTGRARLRVMHRMVAHQGAIWQKSVEKHRDHQRAEQEGPKGGQAPAPGHVPTSAAAAAPQAHVAGRPVAAAAPAARAAAPAAPMAQMQAQQPQQQLTMQQVQQMPLQQLTMLIHQYNMQRQQLHGFFLKLQQQIQGGGSGLTPQQQQQLHQQNAVYVHRFNQLQQHLAVLIQIQQQRVQQQQLQTQGQAQQAGQ